MDSKGQSQDQPAVTEARKARRVLWIVVILFLAINGAILLRVFLTPEPTHNGKTVSEWLAVAPRGVEPEVVNAFGPEVWPYLIGALPNKGSTLKKLYVGVWRNLPPFVQRKLPLLQPINQGQILVKALSWFEQLGPDARGAVPELIKLVREEKSPGLRALPIHMLGSIGVDSPEALGVLIDVMGEPETMLSANVGLSAVVASALASFGASAKPAVPFLVRSIRSRPLREPEDEIRVLRCIGPEAKDAVPVLLEALGKPSLENHVLSALAGIGRGAAHAVPALVPFLHNPDDFKRLPALEALLKIGPPAKLALPALKEIEREKTNVLRVLAAVAIGAIESNPEYSTPLLIEALRQPGTPEDPDWMFHVPSFHRSRQDSVAFGPSEAAAWFLSELGPRARTALTELRRCLETRHVWLRLLAARAIWKIEQNENQVVEVLAQLLLRRDDLIVHMALKTLEEIGPKAKTAIPGLVSFIDGKTNRWLARREALKVLEKIDPQTAAKVSLR